MSEQLSAILDELAAGRIDAQEAQRRIAAQEAQSRGVAPGQGGVETVGGALVDLPEPPEPAPVRPAGVGGVERLLVRATGRRLQLVADSSVATVMVDGPHEMRRRGSSVEVTSHGEALPGRTALGQLRSVLGRSALRGTLPEADEVRAAALGQQPVVLRVHPDLLVDLESTAGSVHSQGLGWFTQVRVTAGSAHLAGLHQVDQALVQAGSVTLLGRFDGGRSRVRVESGSLQLALEPRSDVEVHASAQLGRVSWPDDAHLTSYQAGQGRGRLDLDVVLGMAAIRHDLTGPGTPGL